MKHIPIVFPISLLIIVAVTFFSGAYAIAEGAVNGQDGAIAGQIAAGPGPRGPAQQAPSGDHDWYQSAAIWVCPLH